MSLTTNKGIDIIPYGTTGWDVPVNDNSEVIDKALGSYDIISDTDGTVTLSLDQYQNMCLKTASGVDFTEDVTWVIPSGVAGQWVIINQSAANAQGYDLIVKNAANATSVSIPYGVTRTVYSDGTRVTFVDTQSTSDLASFAVGAGRATTNAFTTGTVPNVTATVTFNGGFLVEVGQTVSIRGVTPSGYNGVWEVTASSGGSVSFAVSAALGGQTGAGVLYYGAITGATINLSGKGLLSGRATQDGAETGTENVTIMTPLRTAQAIASQFNVTGSAPLYACRAWVNFEGIGTPSINDSGNVSSITDLGVGNYRVNFTTDMPDANYAVVITAQNASGNNVVSAATTDSSATASRVGVKSYNTAGTLTDTTSFSVAIFR